MRASKSKARTIRPAPWKLTACLEGQQRQHAQPAVSKLTVGVERIAVPSGPHYGFRVIACSFRIRIKGLAVPRITCCCWWWWWCMTSEMETSPGSWGMAVQTLINTENVNTSAVTDARAGKMLVLTRRTRGWLARGWTCDGCLLFEVSRPRSNR